MEKSRLPLFRRRNKSKSPSGSHQGQNREQSPVTQARDPQIDGEHTPLNVVQNNINVNVKSEEILDVSMNAETRVNVEVESRAPHEVSAAWEEKEKGKLAVTDGKPKPVKPPPPSDKPLNEAHIDSKTSSLQTIIKPSLLDSDLGGIEHASLSKDLWLHMSKDSSDKCDIFQKDGLVTSPSRLIKRATRGHSTTSDSSTSPHHDYVELDYTGIYEECLPSPDYQELSNFQSSSSDTSVCSGEPDPSPTDPKARLNSPGPGHYSILSDASRDTSVAKLSLDTSLHESCQCSCCVDINDALSDGDKNEATDTDGFMEGGLCDSFSSNNGSKTQDICTTLVDNDQMALVPRQTLHSDYTSLNRNRQGLTATEACPTISVDSLCDSRSAGSDLCGLQCDYSNQQLPATAIGAALSQPVERVLIETRSSPVTQNSNDQAIRDVIYQQGYRDVYGSHVLHRDNRRGRSETRDLTVKILDSDDPSEIINPYSPPHSAPAHKVSMSSIPEVSECQETSSDQLLSGLLSPTYRGSFPRLASSRRPSCGVRMAELRAGLRHGLDSPKGSLQDFPSRESLNRDSPRSSIIREYSRTSLNDSPRSSFIREISTLRASPETSDSSRESTLRISAQRQRHQSASAVTRGHTSNPATSGPVPGGALHLSRSISDDPSLVQSSSPHREYSPSGIHGSRRDHSGYTPLSPPSSLPHSASHRVSSHLTDSVPDTGLKHCSSQMDNNMQKLTYSRSHQGDTSLSSMDRGCYNLASGSVSRISNATSMNSYVGTAGGVGSTSQVPVNYGSRAQSFFSSQPNLNPALSHLNILRHSYPEATGPTKADPHGFHRSKSRQKSPVYEHIYEEPANLVSPDLDICDYGGSDSMKRSQSSISGDYASLPVKHKLLPKSSSSPSRLKATPLTLPQDDIRQGHDNINDSAETYGGVGMQHRQLPDVPAHQGNKSKTASMTPTVIVSSSKANGNAGDKKLPITKETNSKYAQVKPIKPTGKSSKPGLFQSKLGMMFQRKNKDPARSKSTENSQSPPNLEEKSSLRSRSLSNSRPDLNRSPGPKSPARTPVGGNMSGPRYFQFPSPTPETQPVAAAKKRSGYLSVRTGSGDAMADVPTVEETIGQRSAQAKGSAVPSRQTQSGSPQPQKTVRETRRGSSGLSRLRHPSGPSSPGRITPGSSQDPEPRTPDHTTGQGDPGSGRLTPRKLLPPPKVLPKSRVEKPATASGEAAQKSRSQDSPTEKKTPENKQNKAVEKSSGQRSRPSSAGQRTPSGQAPKYSRTPSQEKDQKSGQVNEPRSGKSSKESSTHSNSTSKLPQVNISPKEVTLRNNTQTPSTSGHARSQTRAHDESKPDAVPKVRMRGEERGKVREIVKRFSGGFESGKNDRTFVRMENNGSFSSLPQPNYSPVSKFVPKLKVGVATQTDARTALNPRPQKTSQRQSGNGCASEIDKTRPVKVTAGDTDTKSPHSENTGHSLEQNITDNGNQSVLITTEDTGEGTAVLLSPGGTELGLVSQPKLVRPYASLNRAKPLFSKFGFSSKSPGLIKSSVIQGSVEEEAPLSWKQIETDKNVDRDDKRDQSPILGGRRAETAWSQETMETITSDCYPANNSRGSNDGNKDCIKCDDPQAVIVGDSVKITGPTGGENNHNQSSNYSPGRDVANSPHKPNGSTHKDNRKPGPEKHSSADNELNSDKRESESCPRHGKQDVALKQETLSYIEKHDQSSESQAMNEEDPEQLQGHKINPSGRLVNDCHNKEAAITAQVSRTNMSGRTNKKFVTNNEVLSATEEHSIDFSSQSCVVIQQQGRVINCPASQDDDGGKSTNQCDNRPDRNQSPSCESVKMRDVGQVSALSLTPTHQGHIPVPMVMSVDNCDLDLRKKEAESLEEGDEALSCDCPKTDHVEKLDQTNGSSDAINNEPSLPNSSQVGHSGELMKPNDESTVQGQTLDEKCPQTTQEDKKSGLNVDGVNQKVRKSKAKTEGEKSDAGSSGTGGDLWWDDENMTDDADSSDLVLDTSNDLSPKSGSRADPESPKDLLIEEISPSNMSPKEKEFQENMENSTRSCVPVSGEIICQFAFQDQPVFNPGIILGTSLSHLSCGEDDDSLFPMQLQESWPSMPDMRPLTKSKMPILDSIQYGSLDRKKVQRGKHFQQMLPMMYSDDCTLADSDGSEAENGNEIWEAFHSGLTQGCTSNTGADTIFGNLRLSESGYDSWKSHDSGSTIQMSKESRFCLNNNFIDDLTEDDNLAQKDRDSSDGNTTLSTVSLISQCDLVRMSEVDNSGGEPQSPDDASTDVDIRSRSKKSASEETLLGEEEVQALLLPSSGMLRLTYSDPNSVGHTPDSPLEPLSVQYEAIYESLLNDYKRSSGELRKVPPSGETEIDLEKIYVKINGSPASPHQYVEIDPVHIDADSRCIGENTDVQFTEKQIAGKQQDNMKQPQASTGSSLTNEPQLMTDSDPDLDPDFENHTSLLKQQSSSDKWDFSTGSENQSRLERESDHDALTMENSLILRKSENICGISGAICLPDHHHLCGASKTGEEWINAPMRGNITELLPTRDCPETDQANSPEILSMHDIDRAITTASDSPSISSDKPGPSTSGPGSMEPVLPPCLEHCDNPDNTPLLVTCHTKCEKKYLQCKTSICDHSQQTCRGCVIETDNNPCMISRNREGIKITDTAHASSNESFLSSNNNQHCVAGSEKMGQEKTTKAHDKLVGSQEKSQRKLMELDPGISAEVSGCGVCDEMCSDRGQPQGGRLVSQNYEEDGDNGLARQRERLSVPTRGAVNPLAPVRFNNFPHQASDNTNGHVIKKHSIPKNYSPSPLTNLANKNNHSKSQSPRSNGPVRVNGNGGKFNNARERNLSAYVADLRESSSSLDDSMESYSSNEYSRSSGTYSIDSIDGSFCLPGGSTGFPLDGSTSELQDTDSDSHRVSEESVPSTEAPRAHSSPTLTHRTRKIHNENPSDQFLSGEVCLKRFRASSKLNVKNGFDSEGEGQEGSLMKEIAVSESSIYIRARKLSTTGAHTDEDDLMSAESINHTDADKINCDDFILIPSVRQNGRPKVMTRYGKQSREIETLGLQDENGFDAPKSDEVKSPTRNSSSDPANTRHVSPGINIRRKAPSPRPRITPPGYYNNKGATPKANVDQTKNLPKYKSPATSPTRPSGLERSRSSSPVKDKVSKLPKKPIPAARRTNSTGVLITRKDEQFPSISSEKKEPNGSAVNIAQLRQKTQAPVRPRSLISLTSSSGNLNAISQASSHKVNVSQRGISGLPQRNSKQTSISPDKINVPNKSGDSNHTVPPNQVNNEPSVKNSNSVSEKGVPVKRNHLQQSPTRSSGYGVTRQKSPLDSSGNLPHASRIPGGITRQTSPRDSNYRKSPITNNSGRNPGNSPVGNHGKSPIIEKSPVDTNSKPNGSPQNENNSPNSNLTDSSQPSHENVQHQTQDGAVGRSGIPELRPGVRRSSKKPTNSRLPSFSKASKGKFQV